MMPPLGLLFVCDRIGQLNSTLSSEHTSFQKGKTGPLTKVTLVLLKKIEAEARAIAQQKGVSLACG